MSHRSVLLWRGDIVLATFQFTDLSGSKKRPAVVLTTGQPDVILAFISSVVVTQLTPHDLQLLSTSSDFAQTGLKGTSVIRLNKLATIERRLITRRLGSLSTRLVQAVDDALVRALGVDLARYLAAERGRLAQILTKQGPEALARAVQK
jgi:mRNA interferase MazF